MSRATYTRGSIGRSGKLLGLAALASLLVLSAAYAQTKGTPGDDRGLRLVTLAPIPAASNNSTGGGMYSFDISYVDSITGNYYLADRSNRVVDFVDSIGRYVTGIPASPAFAGFTGSNSTSGPNGVVAAFPWLFATDANSRVVTIDLRNNSTVSNASTGGARVCGRTNWLMTRRMECCWWSTTPTPRLSPRSSSSTKAPAS